MSKEQSRHIGSDALEDIRARLKSKTFRKKFEQQRMKVSVGQMVRRITEEMNFSVRDLAKKMGSSVSQVQRLLEDKNVSVGTLIRFANATDRKLEIKFR